jgi:hypothetical protein
MKKRLSAALGLSTLLASSAFAAPTKVKFDSSQTLAFGDEVEIRGKLQVGDFFGPPGFGENPNKDKNERFFILQLPSAIRVSSSGASKDGPDLGVSFLQIIVRDFDKVPLKDKVGRKILLTGKLVPSSGPRNHTPVLIDANQVGVLERWTDEPQSAAPQAAAAPAEAPAQTAKKPEALAPPPPTDGKP